jgi:hypothetical protein
VAISFWDRLGTAVSAGASAFGAAWGNPLGQKPLSDFKARQHWAEFCMSWYDGSVMDPALPYLGQLKSALRLYRWTRLTWNVVPDLCDFWAGIMYPGEIGDGGPESAMPLLPPKGDGPVDPALLAAILQVWDWSDMGTLKSDFPRMAAITGSAFMQGVDIPAKGKVYAELVRMSYLKELELDLVGNVVRYVLEYRQVDPKSGKEHTVRKEVTREAFRTYRDDKPFDFSDEGLPTDQRQGSEWENPYGFVPAVFWPFRRAVGGIGGGPWGAPALGAHLGELARINSLESHMDDQVHKAINPIALIWADGDLSILTSKERKRGRTDSRTGARGTSATRHGPDSSADDAAQEEIRFYQGKQGGSVSTISGSPEAIGEARQYLADAKGGFKDAFPELTLYKELRAMTQVTGPAAEILLGDTKADVVERRSSLDKQMVKMTQMLISMAATRANLGSRPGGWLSAPSAVSSLSSLPVRRLQLTRAQDLFTQFTNPDSYEDGKLDFRIGSRQMVPEAPLSEKERVELAEIRLNKLGLPRTYVWKELNVPAKVIAEAEREAQEREQAAAEARQAALDAAQNAQPGQPAQNGDGAARGTQQDGSGAQRGPGGQSGTVGGRG